MRQADPRTQGRLWVSMSCGHGVRTQSVLSVGWEWVVWRLLGGEEAILDGWVLVDRGLLSVVEQLRYGSDVIQTPRVSGILKSIR